MGSDFSMTFSMDELLNIQRYLKFAGRYMVDQFNNETDPKMAEKEWQEVTDITALMKRIRDAAENALFEKKGE